MKFEEFKNQICAANEKSYPQKVSIFSLYIYFHLNTWCSISFNIKFIQQQEIAKRPMNHFSEHFLK